jgi:hypothetical protein
VAQDRNRLWAVVNAMMNPRVLMPQSELVEIHWNSKYSSKCIICI